jgi:hypothetical protein
VKAVSKKERAKLRAIVEEAANETLVMDTRAARRVGPASCSSLVSTTADVPPPPPTSARAPSAARADVRKGFFAATKRFAAHRLVAPAAFVSVFAVGLGSELFHETNPQVASRTRAEAVTAGASLAMDSDAFTRAQEHKREPVATTPVAAPRFAAAPRSMKPPTASKLPSSGQLTVDTSDPWSSSPKAAR